MRPLALLIILIAASSFLCSAVIGEVASPAANADRVKRYAKPKIAPVRVTKLTVDDSTGYIQADVASQAAALTKDAKVMLYMDNVQIAEYVWPKDVRKRSCCRRAFEERNPPAQRTCSGGKSDRKIHVQIILDPNEQISDKSGLHRETTLRARQDLTVEGLYKDPGNRVGVLIANTGICGSTTWSFKVYWDGVLKQTSEVYASIPGAGYSRVLLSPQPPADLQKIRIEIIPTNPEYEANPNNNAYESPNGIHATSDYDMKVLDLKFQGEVRWWYETEVPGFCGMDDFYLIMPVLRNVGTKDMPANHVRFEVFIDGVSVGEKEIYMSCKINENALEAHPAFTGSNLPTLPPGTHTVAFKILSQDGQNGNNVLQKVMFRP